jgi:hypothetical protein
VFGLKHALVIPIKNPFIFFASICLLEFFSFGILRLEYSEKVKKVFLN